MSDTQTQADAAPIIGQHDLSTSTGGRAYIAEFFAKRLRRHDFARYIAERLAADFACALAIYLSDHEAAIASSAGDQETGIVRTTHPALRNGKAGTLKCDSDNLEHLTDGFAFAHAELKEGFQAHPLRLTSGSVRPLDNNRCFNLARGEAYMNQKTSDEFLYAHIDHGSPRSACRGIVA